MQVVLFAVKALFTGVLLRRSLGVEGASYSFSEASSPVTGNQVATISVLDSFQLDFDIVFHSVNSEWTNIFHVGNSGVFQRLPTLFWFSDNLPRMQVVTSTNKSSTGEHYNTGDLELERNYHVFIELRSDGVYRGKLDSTQMFWRGARKIQSAENVPIWFSDGGATDCTVSNLIYVTPIPVPTSTATPTSTERSTTSLAADTSTTTLKPTTTTPKPTTTLQPTSTRPVTALPTSTQPTVTWPKTTSTTVGTAASHQSTGGRSTTQMESTALEGDTTSTGVRTTHSESSTQLSANATTESTPLTTSQHSDDTSFEWTLLLLIVVAIGVVFVLVAVFFVLFRACKKEGCEGHKKEMEVAKMHTAEKREISSQLEEESSESNAWDKVVPVKGVDSRTEKAPESSPRFGTYDSDDLLYVDFAAPTPMGPVSSAKASEPCEYISDKQVAIELQIKLSHSGEGATDHMYEGTTLGGEAVTAGHSEAGGQFNGHVTPGAPPHRSQ